MECDIAQGSFFNEPLDTDNATRLIENIETAHASSFAEYHAYLKDNKINLATK